MCDETTEAEAERYRKRKGLTRREFNTVASAALLAANLPAMANVADVTEQEVIVPTPDGESDCYLVHPVSGKHPAVIMWPDIMGIRPAFRAMGKRLAQAGYTVLVINPYYRTHKGEVISEGEGFHIPEVRERLMKFRNSLSNETCVTDGVSYVRYLDNLAAADNSRQIGTCGYCMSGSYTIRLAAALPERIGAAASFHGGGLVTDETDSPHRMIAKIDAGLLIAIAENDHERQPEAIAELKKASEAAGVNAEIEVYEGAMHGWCPPDSRAYNHEQAEIAWGRMLALFQREL